MNKLPSVQSCFNNWSPFPTDLAKTEYSIYYSHYMKEDIMEEPSYDLSKRELMLPGIDSIPLYWLSPRSHGNRGLQEASVFFQWILISSPLGGSEGLSTRSSYTSTCEDKNDQKSSWASNGLGPWVAAVNALLPSGSSVTPSSGFLGGSSYNGMCALVWIPLGV